MRRDGSPTTPVMSSSRATSSRAAGDATTRAAASSARSAPSSSACAPGGGRRASTTRPGASASPTTDCDVHRPPGDHEIGDDPWRRARDAWTDFKRRHVPDFKQVFADQMLTDAGGSTRFPTDPRGQARDTAYAVRLAPNVLLVTLDVFERRGGDVHMSVDPAQLALVRAGARQARRDEVPWVMVQGHVPMTGDVRTRNSSHLVYERGGRSALWKAMVDGGVDVYLNGEVHDQTVHPRDGILEARTAAVLPRRGLRRRRPGHRRPARPGVPPVQWRDRLRGPALDHLATGRPGHIAIRTRRS